MSNNGYGASRSSYRSSGQRFNPMRNGNGGNNFSRDYPKNRNRFSNSGPPRGGNTNGFGIRFGEAGAGLAAIDWSTVELAEFQKNFYTETEATSNLTTTEVSKWQQDNGIQCCAGYRDQFGSKNNGHQVWNNNTNESATVKYPDVPKPILSFEDASFPTVVSSSIKRAGFEKPTAIQSATWPITLQGYDVIGIARTGSGKTLAFLLPAIVHIKAQPALRRGDGPIALIIAPTRELACQIEGEVEKFACNTRHCCVYGGVKKYEQKKKLYQGVEIVIATPGRLLDFLESNVTNLKRTTYTVIDEADRLLDMGFEPQLNAIMNQIRPDRQMMMFSATWPKEVRALAKKYFLNKKDDSNVFQVAIGGAFDKLQANENVTQKIQFVSQFDKFNELKQIIDEQLKSDAQSKILVFIATKKNVSSIQDSMWQDGYYVTAIHGNKEQKQRDRALNDFKRGRMQIMLATDVASRGIHVDDIKLVINYDFPSAIEDYIHRIGRTGRAGTKGVAISFFEATTDAPRAKALIKILRDAKQTIPEELYKYERVSSKKRYSRYNNYNRGFQRRY